MYGGTIKVIIMKHIKLFCISFFFLFFNSCIQEDENVVSGKGSKRFRVPLDDGFTLVSLDAANPKAPIFTIIRDVTSGNDLNSVASLKFEIDEDLLASYNEDNETNLLLLDPDLYSLEGVSTNEINFSIGEAQKELIIEVDPSGLDFNNEYAIPFRFIATNDYGISNTSQTAIVQVGVKNRYDGEYDLNLTMTGWAAFNILDGVPMDFTDGIALVTTGRNTVEIINLRTGTQLLPGFSSASTPPAATQFGNASPAFTFDDNGFITNIVNIIPDGARNRSFQINPASNQSDNFYDETTQTIKANFLFTQSDRPPCTVVWELKYRGPRD